MIEQPEFDPARVGRPEEGKASGSAPPLSSSSTIDRLTAELAEARKEIDAIETQRIEAVYIARALAHAYTTDNRPVQWMVKTALAYPVKANDSIFDGCGRHSGVRVGTICGKCQLQRAESAESQLAALREAISAAFQPDEASPLQHYGTCGWWANRPCDCPIKSIAAALASSRLLSRQEKP
jgi:hypothetical protein